MITVLVALLLTSALLLVLHGFWIYAFVFLSFSIFALGFQALWSKLFDFKRLASSFWSFAFGLYLLALRFLHLERSDLSFWILHLWIVAFGFKVLELSIQILSLEFCVWGFSLLDLIFYFLPNFHLLLFFVCVFKFFVVDFIL